MYRGWVSIHRKLMDTDFWLAEKFTRGQAWVDLIMLANHKDSFLRVRGIKVPIKRGQVGWSETNLAIRWQWSRGKVRRFLNELETVQQIVQQKSNVKSLISINNYDYYQKAVQQTEQQTVQQTEQQTVQQTDTNNNVNNVKNENNVNNTPLPPEGETQTPQIDFKKVLEFYNQTCNRMPQTKTLSETRKKAIKARIKEYSAKKVAEMFTIAAKSDFLNGKNNTGWTASIDWLLKPTNFIKVLEGNYENKIAVTKANDPRASLADGYNEPL